MQKTISITQRILISKYEINRFVFFSRLVYFCRRRNVMISINPANLYRLFMMVAALATAAPSIAQEPLTPGSLLAASCAACHNTQGRSVEGTPVLAGIARNQLISAFQEYQTGARKATVMHRHAKGYNEQEIELLADYFSAQKR
jgi:cytochrome subunit of sulfide dehydrogenase